MLYLDNTLNGGTVHSMKNKHSIISLTLVGHEDCWFVAEQGLTLWYPYQIISSIKISEIGIC